MGGKQSRVVSSDVAHELRPEDEFEGETQVSIRVTQALIDQINGTSDAGAKTVAGTSAEQKEALKKQLQLAYMKGAEDYRKKMEAEKKEASAADTGVDALAQKAELAKQKEEHEHERVQQLVADINKKKFRAPLRDVQCSSEREACLQCYRTKQGDILGCKEVADAFVQCARQNTEKFVGEN